MDDSELWARSLRGDAAAFGVLFDLHHARVFAHAYRLLRSRADAEDAVAVAFLELWRHRSRVRLVDGSPLPWLLVTASNASRNLRRSSLRYRRLLSRLAGEAATDQRGVAELRGYEAGTSDDPRLAHLRTLSATDSALVALVMIEGFSIADAAATVGRSPSAAKARLHRIRERVRANQPFDVAKEAAR